MGEAFIVRKFGTNQQTIKPKINFIALTNTSVSFSIKNQDAKQALIVWEMDDATPDENSIELAGGATSNQIDVNNLNPGQTYVLTVIATTANKIESVTSTLTFTTTSFIAATGGTITFAEENGELYKVHTFTANGTFAVTDPGVGNNAKLEFVVAGGGGGNGSHGGNGPGRGGAGGFRTNILSVYATGTVSTATTSYIEPINANYATNEFLRLGLKITAGTGAGQLRLITSNTATRINITPAWATTPDGTSEFQIQSLSGAVTEPLSSITATLQNYGISIGAAGALGSSSNRGGNGGSTSALSNTGSGGGGGGGANNGQQNGNSGGSGGGGGSNRPAAGGVGGGGFGGQGFSGGNGATSAPNDSARAGGGGGGAGSAGGNANASGWSAGGQGSGLATSIRGKRHLDTETYYETFSGNGTAPAPNTGAANDSGIAIIRYKANFRTITFSLISGSTAIIGDTVALIPEGSTLQDALDLLNPSIQGSNLTYWYDEGKTEVALPTDTFEYFDKTIYVDGQ